MDKPPSPGSEEAQALGCTCPVIDNGYGKGAWATWDTPDGEKQFWITLACPLHAPDSMRPTESKTDGQE